MAFPEDVPVRAAAQLGRRLSPGEVVPALRRFQRTQAPANPPDNEVSASSWLEICKLENAIFERDNVKDDTF